MLTNKVITRVLLPQEPGEWIEVRAPSFFMLQECGAGDDFDWHKLFTRCITAWSYEEPPTPDTIGELDSATVACLINEVRIVRTPDEEKKDGSTSTELSTAKGKRRTNG